MSTRKLSRLTTILLAPVVTALCVVVAAQAQTPQRNTMAQGTTSTKQLVIIGASYAGKWGQPQLPGYRVINKGVGGEESWQVAARFANDALASKPDVVLIWGHINDITRSTPDRYAIARERAIGSYQQMLAQARAANVQVILATEITLPTAVGWRDWIPATIARLRGKVSYAETINREVQAVNAWLRKTAAEEKLVLLDLEKAVADDDGGRKPEYTLEDGSHVTAAGYAAITQYAQGKLPR